MVPQHNNASNEQGSPGKEENIEHSSTTSMGLVLSNEGESGGNEIFVLTLDFMSVDHDDKSEHGDAKDPNSSEHTGQNSRNDELCLRGSEICKVEGKGEETLNKES